MNSVPDQVAQPIRFSQAQVDEMVGRAVQMMDPGRTYVTLAEVLSDIGHAGTRSTHIIRLVSEALYRLGFEPKVITMADRSQFRAWMTPGKAVT